MPTLQSIRRPRSLGQRLGTSAAVVFVALILAACGSAGSALPNTGDRVANPPGAAAAPSGAPALDEQSGAGGTGSQSAPNDPIVDEALIVKTGTLTMQVDDVGAALLKARADILRIGGYISGSQQSRSGDQITASVTYRFPSARWEDALDAIKARGELKDEKTDSTEVTGQVVDLDARIANLRTTERALQGIMQKATKIPDILEVQNQLTQVQGQIEQLSAQSARLRDQASLSTLTVIFQTPPAPIVKETSKGWNAGAEFDRAVGQLLALGQGLATIGIWLAVVALPVGLGFAIVLALVVALIRRLPGVPPRPAGPPAVAGGSEG